jgi:hypothetical protein
MQVQCHQTTFVSVKNEKLSEEEEVGIIKVYEWARVLFKLQ